MIDVVPELYSRIVRSHDRWWSRHEEGKVFIVVVYVEEGIVGGGVLEDDRVDLFS